MKVRDLVEVTLLYVGVPAVTLYPLGFVALLIQLRWDITQDAAGRRGAAGSQGLWGCI